MMFLHAVKDGLRVLKTIVTEWWRARQARRSLAAAAVAGNARSQPANHAHAPMLEMPGADSQPGLSA